MQPPAEKCQERGRDALTALRRIIRATEFGSRRLARETGLTSSQMIVLRLLGENEETPGAISIRIGLTQATVTALVDKLEERGLVARRRGKDDRRHVWIALTAAGRTLLAGMPTHPQTLFQLAFTELADWEQAMMVATLERIASMLNAENILAGPVLELGDLTDREPPAPV